MYGSYGEVVDPLLELQEVVADPDTVYHLRKLLVGAPFLKIVVEGSWDCSDLEGDVSWLLPAGWHG